MTEPRRFGHRPGERGKGRAGQGSLAGDAPGDTPGDAPGVDSATDDFPGDDAPADGPALRERALRLLARRDHSRAELSRKLAGAGQSAEALAAVLDDLARLGLLSDQRYAEQRSLARGKRLGNARLVHELRTKGVEDAIIESALDSLGDELSRAREVWRRKFRGQPPGNRAEWAKQARFLQGRGFPADLIRQLLDEPEHDRNDCTD